MTAAPQTRRPELLERPTSLSSSIPWPERLGRISNAERALAFGFGFAAVLVVICVSVLWAYTLRGDAGVHLEPQGNARVQLAREWIESGKPQQRLELYDDLPERVRVALLPRDATLIEDRVVPKDYAYAVTLTAAASVFGSAGTIGVGIAAYAAATALVAVLVHQRTGSPAFSALAALSASTSVFWWSSAWGGQMVMLAGVACGLGAVAIWSRDRNPSVAGVEIDRHFVGGLLAGAATGFHYTTAVWWGALGLAFAVNATSWRQAFRNVAWLAAGAALALVPVAAFNAWVYGSPLKTGYGLFESVLSRIGWPGSSVGFSPSTMWENVSRYLLRPEVLPLGVALLLTAYFATRWSTERPSLIRHRIQFAIVGAGLLALLTITGSSRLWGTNSFVTNASFLRYLSGPYAVGLCTAVVGLHFIWYRHIARVGIALGIAAYIVTNVAIVVLGSSGYRESWEAVPDARRERSALLDVIPHDALVITRTKDKVLYPERSVLVASYLQESAVRDATARHLYETVPNPIDLAEAIIAIGNRPLFLLNDGGWVSAQNRAALEALVAPAGRCISDTTLPGLWEVARCTTAR